MDPRPPSTIAAALAANFLGHSPLWYKRTILAFLLVNPLLFAASPYLAGWALVLEFIFTLAMALRCYPLQPGGLLAIEAVAIGMTSPTAVYQETATGIEVLLLLIFMVAGIFFLKQLLLFVFTTVLLRVRAKWLLSLFFCGARSLTFGLPRRADGYGRRHHGGGRLLRRLPQGGFRQAVPARRSRPVER